MFIKLMRGALWRQKGRMLMIALTVALGTSLATAMLNVMLDVGDKINQELKAYGANIRVLPRQVSVLGSLYGTDDDSLYLREAELGKLKTIFWAFNIIDFAPYLTVTARTEARTEDASEVKVQGTWFHRHLELPQILVDPQG